MSLRLRLLNAALIRVEKPQLARAAGPLQARAQFESKAWLFHKPKHAFHLDDTLDDVPATWSASGRTNDGVILYLHGGAYFMGSPRTHRAMLARLSGLTGLRACLPDYRKAPEHVFPAAVEDAWAAWRTLLERGYRPDQIILGGDSAGGGLMLSLLSLICQRGDARPAGAFAFSPWVDLTLSGKTLETNADCDRLLPRSRVDEARDTYLGDADPKDPRASPLFAEFPNCPPVLLMAAETEILRDDTLRMAQVLGKFSDDVMLDLWGDLPHVWPIFQGWLPEADEALRRVARFTKPLLRAAKSGN